MGGPNMKGSSITGLIILAIIGLIIFIKSSSKNKKRLLKTIGFVFAALITRGIVAAAVADSGVDIDGLTPATLIALGIILVEFFALRNKKLMTRILAPALTVIGFILLILTVVNSNKISDVFSPGVLLIIAAVIALIIIFKKASGKVKAVLQEPGAKALFLIVPMNKEIIQALSCLRHDADRNTAITNLQSFAASLLGAQYPLGYFP